MQAGPIAVLVAVVAVGGVIGWVAGRAHLQTNGDLRVVSLLPPFAPVLMPVRMATGDAPAWQVAVAMALTAATSGAPTWLAGRTYANSVLRLGARVRVLDALRGR